VDERGRVITIYSEPRQVVDKSGKRMTIVSCLPGNEHLC
jgi:hypothetical protein